MVAARVDQMCKTVSIFPSFICCLSISTWGKLSSVLTNDHFAIQTERRNLFKILYRFTDSLKISICVKVTLKEKKKLNLYTDLHGKYDCVKEDYLYACERREMKNPGFLHASQTNSPWSNVSRKEFMWISVSQCRFREEMSHHGNV